MCYFVLTHGNTQVNAKLKDQKHHSFGSKQAKLVFDKMHPELVILISEFNLVHSSILLSSAESILGVGIRTYELQLLTN